MAFSTSQPRPDPQEPQQANKPPEATPNERAGGPPRALGSQTDMGDQEELDGLSEAIRNEEARVSDQEEEQAHSNTTAQHGARRTRTGERDRFGMQGQY